MRCLPSWPIRPQRRFGHLRSGREERAEPLAPVAPPWSTVAAGWGAVGSNRTLLHTPPGNPAGPLALDARDSSPPTARSP